MSLKKDIIIYGLLVKWFNTRASQARIHGFKPRTGYQIKIKNPFKDFFNFINVLV